MSKKDKPPANDALAGDATGDATGDKISYRMAASDKFLNDKFAGGSRADDKTPANDRDRPLYMISVAAELAGMHPQTLRIYENKGLVNPKRSAGNTRLYSQADIEQLELIGQLTSEGINLAGVLRITDLQERLEKKEEEIEALRRRITRLEDRVHELNMRQQITALAKADTQMIQLWQE
jgi:MerR family transcriptional regulator/heat shock protein HspR